MTRVVFFGTPETAVPTLTELAASHEIDLVVTRPDRPRGRSGSPSPPPVKEAARRLGVPVAQPERASDIIDSIRRSGDFDVGVIVAYGHILRPEVLDHPAHGILNVHFSLLPRWRGAAPVARALMAGDTMTGVTIIKLDEGLDTGPVLTAQAIDIEPSLDRSGLEAVLANLGARLMGRSLPSYLSGGSEPVPQSDDGATYAHRITAEDRPLDVSGERDTFINRVRALSPQPGATLSLDGVVHKILGASPVDAVPHPGTWAAVDDMPTVSVGGRGVALTRLQAPGRSVVTGPEWVRGTHRRQGSLP